MDNLARFSIQLGLYHINHQENLKVVHHIFEAVIFRRGFPLEMRQDFIDGTYFGMTVTGAVQEVEDFFITSKFPAEKTK